MDYTHCHSREHTDGYGTWRGRVYTHKIQNTYLFTFKTKEEMTQTWPPQWESLSNRGVFHHTFLPCVWFREKIHFSNMHSYMQCITSIHWLCHIVTMMLNTCFTIKSGLGLPEDSHPPGSAASWERSDWLGCTQGCAESLHPGKNPNV